MVHIYVTIEFQDAFGYVSSGAVDIVGGGVAYITNMFQIITVSVLITTVTIVVILICSTLSLLHILCSITSYFPARRPCKQCFPARVGDWYTALGVRGGREPTWGCRARFEFTVLPPHPSPFLSRLVRPTRIGRRNVPRFQILSSVLSFFFQKREKIT